MSHLWCATIVLVNLIVSVENTCILQKNDTVVVCSTLNELELQGTSSWLGFTAANYGNESFTTLKANAFRQTPNLEHISIRGLINHIEVNAFQDLMKLKVTVSFDKNELRTIPIRWFSNISIQHLSFHDCSIRYFEPGCFHDILHLESITIKKNFLVNIPTGIFNGLNVVKLKLQDNEINTIEMNAFANMKHLIFLALNGNKLTTFVPSSTIGNSSTLIRLWLYQNIITNVTSAMFLGLPNLEVITLGFNQIENIEPQSFKNTKDLVLLDLSGNRLEVLEPNIFPSHGLQNLTKLYIYNNKLTYLSSGVLNRIPHLKYMTLGGNPWQCPCLTHLKTWMANNNITHPCDKDYFLGLRPVCLVSLTNPKDCVYDTESNRELISYYATALAGYPKKLACFL